MAKETCPICTRELHSIITRRIGDTAVCIDCGDYLSPLYIAIGDALCKRMESAMEFMDKPMFSKMEIEENFFPLIDNGMELIKVFETAR